MEGRLTTDLPPGALRGLGLTGEAARAIEAAAAAPRMLRVGEPLVAEGDRPAGVHFVLTGVLKSYRTVDSGSAQTLALHMAGDVLGAQAMALGREAASVVAVTGAQVLLVPAAKLASIMRAQPELAAALWRAVARDAGIQQEWMVGMGRRTARSQIAHLLCEVAARLQTAGQARGDRYDFPLTQTELADAVGLSAVHVNRVLQTLRAEGLMELKRGQLRISDWPRMAQVADFDPAYLGAAPPGDTLAPVLLPSGDAQGARTRRDRQLLPQR